MDDFNPLTPLNILTLPSNEYANFDGKKKRQVLLRSCMQKFEPTLRKRMNNIQSKKIRVTLELFLN